MEINYLHVRREYGVSGGFGDARLFKIERGWKRTLYHEELPHAAIDQKAPI
jgi:hypothetical protein